MAEHVANEPDAGESAEILGDGDAHLEVANQRFGAGEIFVGQGVPRADAQAVGLGQLSDDIFALGADFEVVVQEDGLAIGLEAGKARIALHHVQQLVHEFDQVVAEILEGLIPFAVPVGAGDVKGFEFLVGHVQCSPRRLKVVRSVAGMGGSLRAQPRFEGPLPASTGR